jgi:hypothetical protein
MPPRSSTSSSLLFSLLALGSLTGSSVTASPALEARQFGTGTGTGSGSGGCAALVASGNYSQSLLPLTSRRISFILSFIRRTNSDLYVLTFTSMSCSCNTIYTYTCHAFLDLYSLYALGRPGVLGIYPVFGECEDEHVGLYQGDVGS